MSLYACIRTKEASSQHGYPCRSIWNPTRASIPFNWPCNLVIAFDGIEIRMECQLLLDPLGWILVTLSKVGVDAPLVLFFGAVSGSIRYERAIRSRTSTATLLD